MGRRFHRLWCLVGLWSLLLAGSAAAQATDLIGLPIIGVRVEQEGRVVTDRLIEGLISTRVGQPLSMRDVRQSIDHLYGLNRFDDVRVIPERSGTGVLVRYVLVPRHTIEAVEFRGKLGIPEDDLRQAMSSRFGALPPAARANDIARAFVELYRQHGFLRAKVQPIVQELHEPDRGVLTFTIDAGQRAVIQRLDIEGLQGDERTKLEHELDLRPGRGYDSAVLDRQLQRYEADLRARGFYEARVTYETGYTPDGLADVTISVARGPRVQVAFSGDVLPAKVRDELVPLRREGSVDEDLLEDAARAITDYLHGRGYRDADVRYTRQDTGETLVITFNVNRGPRHIVDAVHVKGNSAIPSGEIVKLLQLETGAAFIESAVDRGVGAVTQQYRTRGFTRAKVEPVTAILPRPAGSGPTADRHIEVTVNVAEGPRTEIGSIFLQGNESIGEGQIRGMMKTSPGRPYSETDLAQDRDRIHLEYLNLGFESAVVTPRVTLVDNDTRADVRITISEGPRVIVDQIIIVGNHRTSTETIEQALLLKPGEPLGYTARVESQQRLAALGLFRRFRISDLRHGSEQRRDVLVEVEEAPPTTIGYGGGVEGGYRLRPTGVEGQAQERFELAPRGFVEIGRRNLFGKNRSVNLFARVALKTLDEVSTTPVIQSSYGLNEYRVIAAYREPRIFGTPAELLVTGALDQGLRSSFNYRSREVRAEAAVRVKRIYGISGRYSYSQNTIFDEHFTEPDEPFFIDRLFPQVGISKVSGSLFRDTRDDVLDPNHGTFISMDNDLAARAMGSEVGFVKTYMQASTFRRLPVSRRMVVRMRGLLGLAHGFERLAAQLDANGNVILGPDGQPIIVAVADLPASERFFAGGDTTVRGFSLDRLGTADTISPTGFPRGGNGLFVVNGELLVNAWRAFDVVGFIDAGNVFLQASGVNITDLRPAAGFGLRYRSPIGPLRLDLGFNLQPRELVPGTLERRTVLHVSLGQAF